MIVTFNNKKIKVSENTSVSSVLKTEGIISKKGIAVAINNKVVPNKEWENKEVKKNDKIIVIKATQGG